MKTSPAAFFKFLIPTLLLLFAITLGFSSRAREWLVAPTSEANSAALRLPPVVFWAWERPERLDYLDSSKATVAFLAKTIQLRGSEVIVQPRLQPLSVSKNAPLIAVTRIESDRHQKPQLTSSQQAAIVKALIELAQRDQVVATQIDFDATLSERQFYRELLTVTRKQLPKETGLSITALASWCMGDNWLDDLPIDEAVPMLFRMGVEQNQIISRLQASSEFTAKKCRSSIGISTDEPVAGLPHGRRRYIFNPRSWSPADVEAYLRTTQ